MSKCFLQLRKDLIAEKPSLACVQSLMPWADLTDSRCYYEISGRGDPVLMVSGLGATCDAWQPAGRLGDQFSLVLPDNRGVGRSTAKAAAVSLAHLASDLLELLDYLGLDRVHLVGLSLGGMIAQRFAIDHPSRVDRMVLISSTHHATPYLKQMSSLLETALRRMPWEFFIQTIEVLGSSPSFVDEHMDEIRERVGVSCMRTSSKQAVVRQLRCLADESAECDVSRIEAPTLVLAGEHDNLIPGVYARRTAAEIPNARFHVIAGAGHNPLMEKPEETVDCLRRFLSQDPAAARKLQLQGRQEVSS